MVAEPVVGAVGQVLTELDLSGVWLVDPVAGREGAADLIVREGRIESVVWLEGDEAAGIGPKGVVVAPGFTDLHVHLREPGNEDAETVATGLAAAAHGGFTTVCAMPNTDPTLDEPGVLARIRGAAAESDSPVRLLAYGAVTVGRRGEQLAALGEMADAGVVGFSDDGSPVSSSTILRNALAYAGMTGLPIVDHAEDTRRPTARRRTTVWWQPCSGCAAGRLRPRRRPSPAISRSSRRSSATCQRRGST